MYPTITIPILDVELRSYYLLHGIAYVIFVLLLRSLTLQDRHLNRHWWRLGVLLALADLGMAHAANAVMLNGIGVLTLPSTWWPFGSGFWGGPLFAAIALGAYVFVYRLPAYPVLDVLGVAWLVSAGINKLACLLNGCCYGTRCSSDWWLCVQARHPLPIYEAVLYVAGALCLALWLGHRLRGRLVLVMGLYYGLIQIVIQPLRAASDAYVGSGAFFTLRQGVALVVVSFCTTMLLLYAIHHRFHSSESASDASGALVPDAKP